jgi:hypothetical protein
MSSDDGFAPTAEHIRSLLDYDPETGDFTWKYRSGDDSRITNWNRRWAGKRSYNMDRKGYLKIVLKPRQYKAHRLAWLYVYGEWPKGEIDHIDGNRANNAIANLRVATARQNQSNKTMKTAQSGFRGVTKHFNKWRAMIRVDGKTTHLGLFDTPEAASAAYKAAAAANFGEFAYSRANDGK